MDRDALVERVALDAANRRRAQWSLPPLKKPPPDQGDWGNLLEDARAALAVIEPVVREDERSPKRMRASFERGFPKEGGA